MFILFERHLHWTIFIQLRHHVDAASGMFDTVSGKTKRQNQILSYKSTHFKYPITALTVQYA